MPMANIHAPTESAGTWLKKRRLDQDRQFVRQPTQDELDGALSKGDGIVEPFKAFSVEVLF
jgi:hypothetical protein